MELKELIKKISGEDEFVKLLYQTYPEILNVSKSDYGDYIVYLDKNKIKYGHAIDSTQVSLFGKTNCFTDGNMHVIKINKYQAPDLASYWEGLNVARRRVVSLDAKLAIKPQCLECSAKEIRKRGECDGWDCD
jgi:hypothetical protein